MKHLLKFSIYLLISFFSSIGNAQWSWTLLEEMPFPTANNAVCEAIIGENKYVYSFGGISEGLISDSIHQRSFKYTVSNNSWTEVQSLPDTLGKIASGASFVQNKIFIIGGYHVAENGMEYSSNKVHIYNPFLDTFEVDGANIPIPIDDHVQLVWRDSLIFVVTGWSNSANVNAVQIYNPSFNSWMMGTSLPNDNTYKAFGASGYILGDTIFYFGGVSGTTNFQAQSHFRKGVINPEDPTQITWSYEGNAPGDASYRAASSGHDKTVFFVGGSSIAYNFDAIAYDGTGAVEPSNRIVTYSTKDDSFQDLDQFFAVMDLRGIAKLGGGNWIICGGIDSLQTVSNRTFLLNNPSLSEINQAIIPPFFEVIEINDEYKIITENVGKIYVFNSMGQLLFQKRKLLADMIINSSKLDSEILIFVYDDGSSVPVSRKIIQVKD